MARRQIPGLRASKRDGHIALACRHQRHAPGDAGQGHESHGKHGLGMGQGVAHIRLVGEQGHLSGLDARRPAAQHRFPIAREDSTLAPGENVAVGKGTVPGLHHTQHGQAVLHQGNGHGGSTAPFQVGRCAVIGIHHPHRSAFNVRNLVPQHALGSFLPQPGFTREVPAQMLADQILHLLVHMGMAALSTRPAWTMEFLPQLDSAQLGGFKDHPQAMCKVGVGKGHEGLRRVGPRSTKKAGLSAGLHSGAWRRRELNPRPKKRFPGRLHV